MDWLSTHKKLLTAALGGIGLAWFVWHGTQRYFDMQRFPRLPAVVASVRTSDVLLVDRSGKPLHELRREVRERRLHWVSLAKISPELVDYVVAAEDKRFYRHRGVDLAGIFGSIRDRVFHGIHRGGSTITMQAAELLRGQGTGHRTWKQKFRQIQSALLLEREWAKDEILEAYLNLVSFRGELVGVEAASRGLFQKEPHALDATEAAVLAALLRGPNASPETVTHRACTAFDHLHRDEGSSAATAACAKISQLVASTFSHPYKIEPEVSYAPFIARMLLEKKRDARLIGRAFRTTIDRDLQIFAGHALASQLARISEQNMRDGAVLVLDNQSGDVLAYVGNGGERASAAFVDAIQARRQAGSILKPFLYGLAFEKRMLTPASLLEDKPFEVSVTGGMYRPQNYDKSFGGYVSARTALASSLNIPAVRTLELLGHEPFLRKLRDLGITQPENDDFYGPSLALGAIDVSLWEITNAYRVLANNGVYSEAHFLADPAEARDLFSTQMPGAGSATQQREVFSSGVSFLVADILADREARHRSFGLDSALSTRFWTAVKTGTSQDMRDNWCVGFSNDYTVGVWTGNFSGDPMWNVTGVEGAAPVWVEVMNYLHSSESSLARHAPAGVVAAPVLAAAHAPHTEYFLSGTEPKVDIAASAATAATEATAATIPAARAKIPTALDTPPRKLAEIKDLVKLKAEAPARPETHPSRLPQTVKASPTKVWKKITYPQDGMVIAVDPDIPNPVQKVKFQIAPRDPNLIWYLNGTKLGVTREPQFWQPKRGNWRLSVRDPKGKLVDEVLFQVR